MLMAFASLVQKSVRSAAVNVLQSRFRTLQKPRSPTDLAWTFDNGRMYLAIAAHLVACSSKIIAAD